MAITYANLKQMVANHLGKTNDSTAVTLRDNAINDALRQIYQEGRWSWLLTSTSTALSSSSFDLPADYNPQMGLETAYIAETGTANDHIMLRASVQDLDAYSTSDYVYWISYDTSTNRYQFNSNQSSGTVTFYYYAIPSDLSGASDVCRCPDPSAATYLSVAKYWLASERDETNYDRFYGKYQDRLERMKSNEAAFNTMRKAMVSKIDEINDNVTETLATYR